MFRRSFGACCVALVGVLLAILPSAAAQEVTSDDSAAPVRNLDYADAELTALLERTDLTAAWLESATVSDAAALVATLDEDGEYAQSRAAFLAELDLLAERTQLVDARVASIERVRANTEAVESVVRTVRRSLSTGGQSAGSSLTAAETAELELELAGIVGGDDRPWMGLSLDPLGLAESHVLNLRDELVAVIADLEYVTPRQTKHLENEVARLTALNNELRRVHVLVDRTAALSQHGQLELVSARASLVYLMPDLHRRRLLMPTVVGGLSVVTLDAYVRGAEALDPSCPVEWHLLAGVGRVESRHGTIDDSVVRSSGVVSNPILGPLLDGGATEREAAQAAAEAEAAALAAEQEALAAEAEKDAEPEWDADLWGGDTLARAEELRAQAAPPEPVGSAAPPVEVVETPKPRYDPLLWGDDLPFDEDDLPPLDEDDAETETDGEEEPEFKGNGFAVIVDSDNGVLDGNPRWDRAVGPMQFIPETWSYWATDGNDDGVTDPQNLYDAAASAGRFLCHLSRTRGSSPYSFVLGYNSSQTYVRNVMAFADAYGDTDLPRVAAG